MHTTVAWPSSASKLAACLCIISPVHAMASYAIPSKLHITIHPLTMLIVKSRIVHLTPIPCSLFHFRPNSTLCVVSEFSFIIQSLCPCSPPGSVYLQWICLTLLWTGQSMACHLHLILCTWNTVATWGVAMLVKFSVKYKKTTWIEWHKSSL